MPPLLYFCFNLIFQPMIIRRATSDEAKTIKPWDEFIGDRRIDTGRGEMFIATDDDEIAGYIVFSSDMFFNKPFIRLLCVKENHQRKGIALALTRHVLQVYKGLEVWTSTEGWNKPAMQLFEKLGFINRGTIAGLNCDGATELFFQCTNA